MDWKHYLEIASYVIAGASLALAGIAPLTKNTSDDKVGRAVELIKALLSKLSLNVRF